MWKKLIIPSFIIIVIVSSCAKTPEACFTVQDPLYDSLLIKDDTLIFSAACTREASDYEWSFGDTSASVTGQTVTHVYKVRGTYKVILIARNSKKSNETFKLINVDTLSN